jgi:DNA-binding NarL/FixJ family response regulator
MVNENLLIEPVARRWWLLTRALECAPLAEAIELVQATEEFLASAPHDDDPVTLPRELALLMSPIESAAHVASDFLGAAATTLQSKAEPTPSSPENGARDPRPHDRKLSPREAEVLSRLANGESNKLIARTLNIADATVKVHVKALLRKIGVINRTQAALWAFNNGFAAAGSACRSLEASEHPVNER